MNWQDHIVSDKEILLGKPTIKGTRISVELVVGLLAQGWTENQILQKLSAIDQGIAASNFCLYSGLYS